MVTTPPTTPTTPPPQPPPPMISLPSPPTTAPRLDIAFPLQVDRRGRTAESGYDDHVREMIEQLLFTSPGERVMRPDYGCGLLDLVFSPNSPELASALTLSVQAALQRWLGDVIEIYALAVTSTDSTVEVDLSYLVRPTGTLATEVFLASPTGSSTGSTP
jgi:phage baseplate assembly protein W